MRFKSNSLFIIWGICFIFCVTIAAAIQLIILPYFLPQFECKAGLLISSDWCVFHEHAEIIAQQIRIHGWNSWKLFTGQNGVTPNIVGALYAVTLPKPWVFIPIAAALHSLSAVLLVLIIQPFFKNTGYSYFIVVPFLFFPSALMSYAQLSKDCIAIAGYCFTFFWISTLAHLKSYTFSVKRISLVSILNIIGLVMIWVTRPYQLRLFLLIEIIGVLPILCFYQKAIRQSGVKRKTLLLSMHVALALLVVYCLPNYHETIPITVPDSPDTKQFVLEWQQTRWLPKQVDSLFHTLADTRNGFIYEGKGSKSSIDTNVQFTKALDIIAYIPRALQIALFSPFPDQWFKAGSNQATTLLRKLSSTESLLFYFCAPSLIFLCFHFRNNFSFLLTLFIPLIFILSFGLVVNNIGTLYRLRFAYWITLFGLSLAGLDQILFYLRSKRKLET